MQSKAKTVAEYLASLPEDRRASISKVRAVIRKNLPKGYEEAMNWGMITYQVPLKTYPKTYNGQPLMYAALASQKNHMAVYLTGIYMVDEQRKDFERKYEASGKKMNAGKSCVRFKKLEDLPLELIGECIATDSVAEFCARFDSMTSARKRVKRTTLHALAAKKERARVAARKKKAARKTKKKAAGKKAGKKAPARKKATRKKTKKVTRR